MMMTGREHDDDDYNNDNAASNADAAVLHDDDDADNGDDGPTSHSLMIDQTSSSSSSSPLHHDHDRPISCLSLVRNALRNPDQLTAMISNYSTAYNAVNVGIALPVLHYAIHNSSSSSSPWGDNNSNGNGSTDDGFSSPSYYYFYTMSRLLDNTNNDSNSTDTNSEQEELLSAEQDSIVASSLLAGMIFGQLIGGILGDILGRRRAIMLVMILQIGGSLGSALLVSTTTAAMNNDVHDSSSEQTHHTALEELARWRFILGIGAGGVYPLAAVMSAENKVDDATNGSGRVPPHNEDGNLISQPNNFASNTPAPDEWMEEGDDEDDGVGHHRTGNNPMRKNGGYAPTSAIVDDTVINPSPVNAHSDTANNASISSFQRIALTFSTQGLGFISVPLLAYPLLELGCNADVLWRVLLGVGALPGVVVLYLRLFSNNIRGCKGNNGANDVDALERDESIPIDDDHDPVTSTNITAPKMHGGEPTLPTSNSINGDGHNILSSSLFSDASSLEINNGAILDENDNELALVEHSYTSSDNSIDHENPAEIRGDAPDNPPMTPLRNRTPGLWESIRTEPDLGRKFAGTAGTWFLFDVLFYGNTLFEPIVIEAAFGSHASSAVDGYKLLQNTVRASLVISLLALPGYFVTVLIIGRRTCVCGSLRSSTSRLGSAACFPCIQTPVYIQMQGFFVMFILYSIIGLFWDSLSNIQWLLLLLYSGTFFFCNYGPNTTTFLLPSVTYSEHCRSTLNGISAAAGKLGALVGASVFAQATDVWGVSVVMMCCGLLSLLAWVLTFISLRQ